MDMIELNNVEFVRVSGPDAIEFLQGQLTCDMTALSASQSLSGALCNLKGRVIANFQIALDHKDCLLRTRIGMADVIVNTLSKYSVFSKVELSIDEKIHVAYGFLGINAQKLLVQAFSDLTKKTGNCSSSSQGICIQLPGEKYRFELWCMDSTLMHKLEELFSSIGTAAQWQREDIIAGIVHVDQESSEKHTPQLLNYDISGVINFKKGCYTGQEVVARMYYRSAPKKRLYLLASDQPIEMEAQLLELKGDSESVAEVLSFSNSPSNSLEPNLLLAILNIKAIDDQSRFVMSNKPDSFLRILSLSYP